MIRYAERIRRFPGGIPPSNRFDWSEVEQKEERKNAPLGFHGSFT